MGAVAVSPKFRFALSVLWSPPILHGRFSCCGIWFGCRVGSDRFPRFTEDSFPCCRVGAVRFPRLAGSTFPVGRIIVSIRSLSSRLPRYDCTRCKCLGNVDISVNVVDGTCRRRAMLVVSGWSINDRRACSNFVASHSLALSMSSRSDGIRSFFESIAFPSLRTQYATSSWFRFSRIRAGAAVTTTYTLSFCNNNVPRHFFRFHGSRFRGSGSCVGGASRRASSGSGLSMNRLRITATSTSISVCCCGSGTAAR